MTNKLQKIGLILALAAVIAGIALVPAFPIAVPMMGSPVDWDWGAMEILKRFVVGRAGVINHTLTDGQR